MSYVGKPFPSIAVKAMSELGDTQVLNLVELAKQEKKKIVLFWYPKDFTFVCPTEIHAFQSALAEFTERNTLVVGASCDSPEVHFAWLTTPRNSGGIEGVTFPLLADTTKRLSTELGILDEEDGVTYRATYLIDETGKVFHESVNDMPLGRNVEEYLRLIDAYAHVQEHGEVCPANWEKGKDAMSATKDGVASYLATH